jgi:hypothetical protein
MREIKFRVWNDASKEMTFFDTPMFTLMKEPVVAFKNCTYNKIMLCGYSEAMQSTGLLDKNGVETYFKDLIRGKLVSSPDLSIIGEVVFDENFFQIGVKNDAGITPLYSIKDIEIIGNVYQNAELMKESV